MDAAHIPALSALAGSAIRHAGDLDPLCAFATVCRRELAIARR
ncbi:hypothetical protein [Methylobacterium sp. J-090]|nr:hypothetical protein [Methylobacterium sp. J-090]